MKDTNFCNHDPDPFCDARDLLDGLIDALHSQRWLHAEHGEVEQLVHKGGFELMRLLLTNVPDKNLTLILYSRERVNIPINARIAHANSIRCLAKWKSAEKATACMALIVFSRKTHN